MPPEWQRHLRCWMAWPYRNDLWHDLEAAQSGYAEVAKAISEFEPVTMLVDPSARASAEALCGDRVEYFLTTINDSWTRDSGPTFLTHKSGQSAGVCWRFNAWGNKHQPWFDDAKMADKVLRREQLTSYHSPLVFEGGAFHVDGQGTVITTEPVVLNDNRNPGLSRKEAEKEICLALGANKVIWLPGDWDEYETDGHVDGLLAFIKPGVVLFESNPDNSDPHSKVIKENLSALEKSKDASGRRFEIIRIEEAFESRPVGEIFCRSYVNFYIANGGIVAPKYNVPGDQRAREVLQKVFPDRKVVMVDVNDIAPGGGGIHCITQQQPLVVNADSEC
ncbi:MAG: agmatine deiminase family protein [bacterium]